MSPTILLELAQNFGLAAQRVTTALEILKDHEDEIRAAWKAHFGR